MLSVYIITNQKNGKKYIGITSKSLEKRFKEHLAQKKQKRLHKAIAKYGKDQFSIDLIETCSDWQQLKEREIFWIAFYNSNKSEFGYNLTAGGDGLIDFKPTEETRQKHSKAAKIKYQQYGHKLQAGRNLYFANNKHPKWHNNPKAEEYKTHLASLASIGAAASKKKRAIKIKDESGKIFDSQADAARFHSICTSELCIHLQGKNSHVKGKKFWRVE